MPTVTVRSTLSIAERLATRKVTTAEGYWSPAGYIDGIVSIAAGAQYNLPSTISGVLIDCPQGLSLKLCWTQGATLVELPIDQYLCIPSSLTDAYISNTATAGPDAKPRILVLT